MMRALVIVMLLASAAVADDKVNARALQQQGIDLYKAKKYDDAIAALAKSYQLDPQYDTLFALAQAERLGGHCPDAIPHYNQILEQTSDPVLAQAVQNNKGLCVTGNDRKKDPECADWSSGSVAVAAAPPKRPIVPIALFAGSGIFAGAAIGLFVAAGHSQDAAKAAIDYGEYDRLTKRAGLERGLGYTFAGVAAVGVGAGVYLLLRKPAETSPSVSASYTGNATTVFVQGRW